MIKTKLTSFGVRLGYKVRKAESKLLASKGVQPSARIVLLLFVAFDMRREARAVLEGRIAYAQLAGEGRLLRVRRNIHRLEKGIIMRPRRLGFGRDYVPSLMVDLNHLETNSQLPEPDKAWAYDVLGEYFRINHSVKEKWFTAAKASYNLACSQTDPGSSFPFPRMDSPVVDITLNQLEILATTRRSVRWFTGENIDSAQVDAAVQIAGLSPSACNRQSFRIHLTYGREQSEKILRTVGGTKGFAHQVPCVAVVVGRLSGYEHAFDRHAIYVDAGLASMSFLFALEVQGLSSCCINWPDKKNQYDALRDLIVIDPDEQVVMLIAIGQADPLGMVPASVKRGIDRLRTTNL